MDKNVELIDNRTMDRFEIQVEDGHKPRVEYTIVDGTYYLNYVHVPSEIRGKGYGELIMKLVLEYLAREEHPVKPVCSFAAAYMRRHPSNQA